MADLLIKDIACCDKCPCRNVDNEYGVSCNLGSDEIDSREFSLQGFDGNQFPKDCPLSGIPPYDDALAKKMVSDWDEKKRIDREKHASSISLSDLNAATDAWFRDNFSPRYFSGTPFLDMLMGRKPEVVVDCGLGTLADRGPCPLGGRCLNPAERRTCSTCGWKPEGTRC